MYFTEFIKQQKCSLIGDSNVKTCEPVLSSYLLLCGENHIHEVHVLKGAVLGCFNHLFKTHEMSSEFSDVTKALIHEWKTYQYS